MSEKSISIGFSPCPNDTFIFDAMINNRIDTEGVSFNAVMADVEELNTRAFSHELEVTKLSFHAFMHVVDRYILLRSGSALGNNCGPILISKKEYDKSDVEGLIIAIPGKYTTANYLLHHAFPNVEHVVEMLFSDIEGAIESNKVDAGLIIHENRFTYEAKGLSKIIDLGKHWHERTNTPIPLGGIAISRSVDLETQKKVNRILKRSVGYAMNNPEKSAEYVKAHAQELEERVIQQHIALYVNNYTRDIGTRGEEAIELMFKDAAKRGIIKDAISKDFVLPG
ncbi:MAG: 1,4-dihydroxy-6-naphthoate synthase [Bacteroidetes bacterium]|nr:1,4-dihydroxy-6-naphthoate synthase [Bacteroidota bacterium]